MIDETVATKAQYYSECRDDLPPCEWQQHFWDTATHVFSPSNIYYDYDPTNHFTCKQCVGSAL